MDELNRKEMILKGIGASNGIAIGSAVVFSKAKIMIEEHNIAAEEIHSEINKLKDALEKTKSEIATMQEKLKTILGDKDIKIFDAHILILNDEVLINEIEKQIKVERKNVDFIFNKIIKRYVTAMSSMQDSYFKERAVDINDVAERVLKNIQEDTILEKTFNSFSGQRIIIADELAPTDIAEFDREKVLAIATESGAKTSHTAILARSMGIPAVVGITGGILEQTQNDDIVIVDGYIGNVIINPSENTLRIYAERETKEEKLYSELLSETRLRPETLDGFRIQLAANIEYPEECESVLRYGAAGIGLMRTEYLIFKTGEAIIPSEEEQYNVYSKVASDMKGQPLIIRTFDIGGDKISKQLNFGHEQNPAMGWRAIRIFLEQKELMKTQIRAVLRAAVFGNVKIMFPMLTHFDEMEAIEQLLNETKADLKREKLPFDENIQVGVMIETPAAAMIAEHLAEKVDFFSIGTNDLTQYSLAVDRTNKKVAGIYQPLHPAILKFISHVIKIAKDNGVYVSVCGEMAGDPAAALLLIGLGANELSMTPSAIGPIRRLIRKIKLREIETLAQTALSMKNQTQIFKMAAEMLNKVAPEIFSLEIL